jgi:hypothetical protein
MVVRYLAHIGEIENTRVLVKRLEERRPFVLRQWKGIPWFVPCSHLKAMRLNSCSVVLPVLLHLYSLSFHADISCYNWLT